MTREQKIAKAHVLREQGATYRVIADRFGVSATTVYRWLNPDYAEASRAFSRAYKDRNREAVRAQNREYVRTHKAECPECGGEMNRGTGRHGGKCAGCHADDIDRRARQIEKWWAGEWTLKQIAAELGWSVNHISRELHRLRAKGYELPYRRPVHPTADGTPRFPEQVPA